MKSFGRWLIIATVMFCCWGSNFFPSTIYAASLWATSSQKREQQAFWFLLRKQFHMNHYERRSEVLEQIHWLQHHPSYLNKTLSNAMPYLYYIYKEITKRHLPGELVLVPIIESAYDPIAYSNRGAAGLWQLMPGTAEGYGLKMDWWYDGRRDIYASTNAALAYFTYLNNFFNSNWLYILAAYDAGEGTVQQAIERNTKTGHSTAFWSLPLPHESHAYVPRLLALAAIIAHSSHYGIRLPLVKNTPYFASVDVGTQIDLAHAAKLAGISLNELYQLNPGYNRWATDPTGPYRILLPINKIAKFKQELSRLPVSKRVTWHRYKVKSGDTLGAIANNFKTTVSLLKAINKIENYIIHPKDMLLIPKHTTSLKNYDFSSELDFVKKNQLKLGPKKIIETVKQGNSLWLIAKKYNVKVSQIRFWNHLTNHKPLTVGQKLTLWLPRPSRIPSKLKSKHIDLAKNYVVKTGDSLGYIAKHFKITVKQIKQDNELRSNVIYIGQRLKISSEKLV